MKWLFSFIIIVSTTSCMAQPSLNEASMNLSNCDIITVSSELDYCVNMNMLASNNYLKTKLLSVESSIQKTYEADIHLGNKLIEKLRKTQVSWEKFRELNCSIEAFEIVVGTPAYITAVNYCKINMNKERVNDLRGF